MRLNNETTRSVGIGGVAALMTTSEFNITDGSKLVEMILDNAYSDPYRATVREICQNASEVDPAFRVHLPTTFEPWFAVIDNGGGMSKEDTIRHASGIGSSTKDGDNTKVGGFGIGMKVPFTISDQYTVISRHGGMSRTFSAYKDDRNRAQFTMLSEVPDDGPSGLEVRVPIRPENFRRIKDAVIRELRWFDPKPKANEDIVWTDLYHTFSGTDWYIIPDLSDPSVIMGNLHYPVDPHKFSPRLRRGLHLRLPIGSCTLPLSREAIIHDERTVKAIQQAADRAEAELQAKVQTAAAWAEYAFQAHRMLLSINYHGDIIWRGMKVTSGAVHLPEGDYRFIPKFMRGFRSLQLNSSCHKIRLQTDGTVRIDWTPDHILTVGDTNGIGVRLMEWVRSTGSSVLLDITPDPAAARQAFWASIYGPDMPVSDFETTVPKVRRGTRVPTGIKVWDPRYRRWEGVSGPVEPGYWLPLYRGVPDAETLVHIKNPDDLAHRLGQLGLEGRIYGVPRSVSAKMLTDAGVKSADEEVGRLLSMFRQSRWHAFDHANSFAYDWGQFPELDIHRKATAFLNDRRFSDPKLKKLRTGLKDVCKIISQSENMFEDRLRRKYPMLALLDWTVRRKPTEEQRQIILNYIMEK